MACALWRLKDVGGRCSIDGGRQWAGPKRRISRAMCRRSGGAAPRRSFNTTPRPSQSDTQGELTRGARRLGAASCASIHESCEIGPERCDLGRPRSDRGHGAAQRALRHSLACPNRNPGFRGRRLHRHPGCRSISLGPRRPRAPGLAEPCRRQAGGTFRLGDRGAQESLSWPVSRPRPTG